MDRIVKIGYYEKRVIITREYYFDDNPPISRMYKVNYQRLAMFMMMAMNNPVVATARTVIFTYNK